MTSFLLRALPVLTVTLCLSGCGGGRPDRSRTAPLRIVVSSPAFLPGAAIPRRYTCDAANVSLPIRWSDVPKHAASLTLVMRDPDAPGGNFIHWQLSGIPASSRGLPAGVVPAGIIQGQNSFGTAGYRGPCPPPGQTHHYSITITALRKGRALAVGSLTGTYRRR